MKLLSLLFTLMIGFDSVCVPIETPDYPEKNELVIRAPFGWGYRTFQGKNGLIGVLWPKGTSFNDCDTAVFVFLQNMEDNLPEEPENGYLFSEKCDKSAFKFVIPEDDEDETMSIGEKYFLGPCGRTEVLFEERIESYRIVIMLASSYYIPKGLFKDVKYIVSAYRKELEKNLGLYQEYVQDIDNNRSKKRQNTKNE